MMGFIEDLERPPLIITIPVLYGSTISGSSSPNMHENMQSTLPELDFDGRLSEHAKSSSKSNGLKALKSFESLQNPPVGSSTDASGALNDAAILIQSHFRGYLVRNTSPLSSLRVISSVKSELRKLKANTCNHEYMEKLRNDPKERLKLSEKIMSLLLRLDGLQGVHPSVREIRRSVARELVDFQEAVDLQLEHEYLPESLEDGNALPSLDDGSDFYLYQMVKIRISSWNLHL